jgi:hypothetical protein
MTVRLSLTLEVKCTIIIATLFLICLWLYSPWLDLGRFFSFVIFFTQSVGLLGRGISSSQDRAICM